MCKDCSKCKCKIRLGIEDSCLPSDNMEGGVPCVNKTHSTTLRLRLLRDIDGVSLPLDLSFATSIEIVLQDSLGRTLELRSMPTIIQEVRQNEEGLNYIDTFFELDFTEGFLNVQVDGEIMASVIVRSPYRNFSNIIGNSNMEIDGLVSETNEPFARGIQAITYGAFPVLNINQIFFDYPPDLEILEREPALERPQGDDLEFNENSDNEGNDEIEETSNNIEE